MRILLYGDVNLNIIDGSSVWLVSLAHTLARAGISVEVQLKAPIEKMTLVGSLTGEKAITLHEPAGEQLSAQKAAARLAEIVESTPIDAVIVRGRQACLAAVENPHLAEKLWAYITDLPHPLTKATSVDIEQVRSVALKARRMFAQTEAARGYLEALAPEAAGKTLLLPPMVSDEFFTTSVREPGPLRLIYSGKFARAWRTLELLSLPTVLKQRHGIDATLDVLGSKFQHDREHPGWAKQMEEELKRAVADSSSNVIWHGGVSREEAMRFAARADIGIGWRTIDLDDSLEISTKALEYAASGTLPIVNDTADHRSLFGDNYPGYVTSNATVEDLADTVAALCGPQQPKPSENGPAGAVEPDWPKAVRDAVSYFSMATAGERLRGYLERSVTITGAANKTKLLIVTHDPKFLGEVVDWLQGRDDVDLRFDTWKTLHDHDATQSKELLGWADTVFCEWAGPNLAYYSQNKRPGTRLITRLHGFELRGPWLSKINFDAIDECVTVSDFYAEKIAQALPDLRGRIHTISNVIDPADFNRPKLGDYAHTLGMVGIVGYGKRLDRALDTLEELHAHDPNYRLIVRGRMPWGYPWEWKDPLQRQLYLDTFERIRRSPYLRNAVAFEPFGADMASWLRRIGIILSPSTHETFHLACAEGMASGAVPIVWERPGSADIFGSDVIVNDAHQAAKNILALGTGAKFTQAGRAAKERAQQWDYLDHVAEWESALGL
ncbi:glycosyl transferase [Corynebacterium sp. 13CS0277]|uniref:glycosyltransferase n=1 Tax=Corynebacterium sp. 13CS0277 TaxID=2071994 RepID=UPI000D0358DB|nr:glycosyltransferase [Corynebacterium sp. 13CS0277]PRQ10341.1 glycosyl transferase [Corynebacterium sp. 13CS0277]